MRKLSVCILFGGVSPEHEVSLRSAESVLNNINQEKYNVFPVGITRSGEWILFGGRDYSMLPSGAWETCELNRKATLSPVRGQGLLSFENDCVVRERIDVVFPLIHGENGEDGSLQGLLQIAGLPFVGSGVAASSACMDKSITKLLIRQAGVRQADWQVIPKQRWSRKQAACIEEIEAAFSYPVFVKPAGTGSSVGISKAKCREDLEQAVTDALRYGNKALVEEFIDGQEIEVAVLGNESPCASVCGEIDAGAEFYDYEAKYLSSSASFYVPARIGEPFFDSVESEIAHLAFAIPAVKGIEFGAGFAFADLRGSQANDPFTMRDGKVVTATNKNGGINGGIANGMPIVFRTAVKPTPSIYKEQDTVDYIAKADAKLQIKGRHDPCIVPRAAVVQNTLAAFAVLDLLTVRYGTLGQK